MAETEKVRRGGRKQNPQATQEVGPDWKVREAVTPPAPFERRAVRRVAGKQEREYAPARFSGERNLDAGQARYEEAVADEPDRPVVMVDRAAGGPMVLESDQVIGGGKVASGARRSQPRQAARPAGGARWMQAPPGAAQDVIVEGGGQDGRDPEAIPTGQQTLSHQQGGIGPALPTGDPCTCAYTWEREGEEIVVYETGGMATGFKGAPSFMTWCIVCGGERDGEFRPENVIRYGDYVPEPVRPVDPAKLASQVQGDVLESVMEQVGSMVASERFIDAIASRVAEKVAASGK